MSKYRFENGKLYKFDKERNAYVFVFSSIYATTKTAAIRMYKESQK